MQKGSDVLERSCLQAGKIFIKEGEECSRAYMIQVGEVSAFTMDGNRKVEIERLKAGAIIGERFLVADELATLSYEATELTTVIIITRQEFQKLLTKVDKNIKTIFDYAIEKIRYYERASTMRAVKNTQIDDATYKLVQSLLSNVPSDKRKNYEDAIVPHINGMITALKDIKKATE